MPNKQADPDLERLWRDRLQRWRASGLPARAFCAAQRLPESSFYFWRAELKRRDAARPVAPPFVPLRVVPPPAPAPAVPLELVTAAGTLRIPPGCDPTLLRAVLAALEELREREQPC
jgi:transposase